MEYVDLRPGARVTVLPEDGDFGAAYEAMVRSVSEHAVRLSMPQRADGFLTIDAGEPITLFTSVQGQIFRFPTRVRLIETSPEEGLVIEPPAEAEKNERRSYYRLITRIVPRYAATVDREGAETPIPGGVILDVSGGGTQMQVLTRVETGTRVHLVFALDGDPLEMDVAADILTVDAPSRGGRYYRLHGRFVGVPRTEVERLIRYVTRQQIELRRRGVF